MDQEGMSETEKNKNETELGLRLTAEQLINDVETEKEDTRDSHVEESSDDGPPLSKTPEADESDVTSETGGEECELSEKEEDGDGDRE
jgi:hypothetical protein